MADTAFVDWPTWEKLVFVLGCAMVVTVLLGIVKLGCTHYRLRQFAAVAKKDAEEQAHDLRAYKNADENSGDTPFGIRALESGIEVEGVWVSRNNSPEPSVYDASAEALLSARERDEVSESKDCNLDDPVQKPDPSTVLSSIFADGITHTNDIVLSATTNNEEECAGIPITKPVRRSHLPPPLAFDRYSGRPCLYRPSHIRSKFDALEAIHNASAQLETTGDESDSSMSMTDGAPISSSAPSLLGDRSSIQSRKTSTDLELLDLRRRSQAAESGQLIPRRKRNSESSERPRSSIQLTSIIPSEGTQERFKSHRKSESSVLVGNRIPISWSESHIEAALSIDRRASTSGVTPTAERRVRSAESVKAAVTEQTSIQSRRSSTPKPQPGPQRPSKQRRPEGSFLKLRETPEVNRGKDSGFEILASGSFDQESQEPRGFESEWARTARVKSMPLALSPVGDQVERRRLQKRRRDSVSNIPTLTASSRRPPLA